MHVTRHTVAAVAVLAAVAAASVPASGQAQAATGAQAQWARLDGAARELGVVLRALAPAARSIRVGVSGAPLSVAADVTTTATLTPTAVVTDTPTVPVSPTATLTPTTRPTTTRTATPRPTHTRTPRPTNTSTPTPRPTNTPTPTSTPRPTNTPTPQPLSVGMTSVGVYQVVKGKELHVRSATLGAQVRLKIIVAVANAPSAGVHLIATWALRGSVGGKTYYSDSHDFQVHNGVTGLFYDIVLSKHDLAVGAYLFVGTIDVNGATQQKATVLHVTGEKISHVALHVHYAHLRLTVPAGWTLDFEKDSNGRPATGADTLVMNSGSRRALVAIVSIKLSTTPSSADLHSFPDQLLRQEFPSRVSNIKPLFFKDQIDGHDVFAAQGDVQIGGRTSQAIAIATNKKRQFYAITIVNYFKSAPASETRAAFASVFGAKLD